MCQNAFVWGKRVKYITWENLIVSKYVTKTVKRIVSERTQEVYIK